MIDAGEGTGWDLHQHQHSEGLRTSARRGASLLMLMAKSRHKKPDHLRKYFHASAEAIAEVTSLFVPGNSGRCPGGPAHGRNRPSVCPALVGYFSRTFAPKPYFGSVLS